MLSYINFSPFHSTRADVITLEERTSYCITIKTQRFSAQFFVLARQVLSASKNTPKKQKLLGLLQKYRNVRKKPRLFLSKKCSDDIQVQRCSLPGASVLKRAIYSVEAQTHPERFFVAQYVHHTVTETHSQSSTQKKKKKKESTPPHEIAHVAA